MRPNLGNLDRILRAIAGLLLVVLYFANVLTGTLGIIGLIIGIVLVLTAVVGFCPLYAPFKFSTRRE